MSGKTSFAAAVVSLLAAVMLVSAFCGCSRGGENGKKFNFGVLIPSGEIKLCLEEWSGR